MLFSGFLPTTRLTASSVLQADVAAEFTSLTEKTTLAAADLSVIEDSAASGAKKKVQQSNNIAGFLASASTLVNVVSATAPAAGKCLRATSSTAAVWSFPAYTVTSVQTTTYTTAFNELALFDTSGGDVICNLPTATTLAGGTIIVANMVSSANKIVVTRAGSDTINTATTLNVLSVAYGTVMLTSTGSAWVVT